MKADYSPQFWKELENCINSNPLTLEQRDKIKQLIENAILDCSRMCCIDTENFGGSDF